MGNKKTNIDTDKIRNGLIITGGIVGTALGGIAGAVLSTNFNNAAAFSIMTTAYGGITGSVLGSWIGDIIEEVVENGSKKTFNKFLPASFKKKKTSEQENQIL